MADLLKRLPVEDFEWTQSEFESEFNPERYGTENGKAYAADEALQILKRFAEEIQPGTIR